MKKKVYNLEFDSWCPEFSIHGYRFYRVHDYKEKVANLQHLASGFSEFKIRTNTGGHAVTAYVDLPDTELDAVLEWADSKSTALADILLFLSLFTGRDVFVAEENFDEDGKFAIKADPRFYQWGGILRCSLPNEDSTEDPDEHSYNIGFEKGLNEVYTLISKSRMAKEVRKRVFPYVSEICF